MGERRGMKTPAHKKTTDRIAFIAALQRSEQSLHALTKKAGVSYSTIYEWLKGDAQKTLRSDTAQKLATALGLSIDQLFTGRSAVRNITCVGKVGAGEAVYMMGSDDQFEVPTPPGLKAGRNYECLEVEGYSMLPAQPGWLVFYQVEPVCVDEVVGNACIVLLSDGRLLFKVVRRFGDAQDRYTLESWSRGIPPIENVVIIEARPFAALTPPP